MELLKDEGGHITITPQVRQIKEFNEIVRSDRAKNKTFSKKVFSYMYFMYDYRSPYFSYPEKRRHDIVIQDLDLGKLKVNEKLKKAIEKFRELRETPSIRILNESRETLQTSVDVIKVLRREIDKAIEEIQNWKSPEAIDDGEYDPAELKEINESINSNLKAKQQLIKNSVDNLQNLLTLSDKIPKSINTLAELEQKVRKEEAGSSRIKGGGEIGLYEN